MAKRDKIKLKRVVVRNNKDVDVCIKDAFGEEHLLFPREEKRILVLVGGKSDKC